MNGIKKVSLYSAEKKKNTCLAFKKSNFKNEEELKQYVDKLKADNREKNRLYSENRIRTGIETKISEPIEHIISDNPYNIHFDDDILLDLNRKCGSSIWILGRSKGGKSTCAMRIYENHYKENKDYICTLFSGNPHIDVYKKNKKDNSLLVTEGFTHEGESYCLLQKHINTRTKNKYFFLNIFDDIIDKKRSEVVAQMYLCWRNANISIISCSQYSKNLQKANRCNANYTIVFGATMEDEKNYIDTILKNFFINEFKIQKYQDMLSLFRYVTANYGFFVIDNLKNKISFCRLKI